MTNNEDFSEKTVNLNPFIQFKIWYSEQLISGVAIPDSVSLGTASENGQVSVRSVLLKHYDDTEAGKDFSYHQIRGPQCFFTGRNPAVR
jgi:pyridoxine/pyridoxamine 5'-phosphate oxidase